MLAFSGGMPLAAAALGEGVAARKRFVSDIASIPGKAPLRLAGEWESWLKSKDALAGGFDMPPWWPGCSAGWPIWRACAWADRCASFPHSMTSCTGWRAA
jgi:hypothetical protein